MNLSATWIRRPVMTTLIMISLFVFGLIGKQLLPINDFPNMDFPVIYVTASLPGASPETMASAVAAPLEKQFSTLSGLESMTSANFQGITYVTLQFSLSRNIDLAAQDVNAAISASTGGLPEMPKPPTFVKSNPSTHAIMYFALTSDTLPLSELNNYADTTVTNKIASISGVAKVDNMSNQKYAVRIKLDPQRLANRGIGLNEVVNAVRKGNVTSPGGFLESSYESYTLGFNSQLYNADEFNNLVVSYQDGAPIRIKDIGEAVDSVSNIKSVAWYFTPKTSQRAIILSVAKQPGANTVQIAEDIKKIIPRINEELPPSANFRVLFDMSSFVRESIKDVQYTLLLTIFLVIIVIFVFIRSLRPTIIPSVAVPLSIVGTFAFMKLLDFSLNNLSLLALTISVGFVVDDAVVVMENIIRRMENGESAEEASFNGSREIGFTVLSMTLSLAIIFIPILFMPGILGRLFKEFAVSIMLAILISGFISLTLTPMLCSRFLKKNGDKIKNGGTFYSLAGKWFNSILRFYGWSLRIVLNYKSLTLVFTILVLGGSVYLVTVIPKGLLPSEDRDYMMVMTQAADRISFSDMVKHQEALNDLVQPTPDATGFISFVGWGMNNLATTILLLKPRNERRTLDEIIGELRLKLNVVPGISAYMSKPETINLGSDGGGPAQWPVTLQSSNLASLYKYTPLMTEKIRSVPGVTDVSSDLQVERPHAEITIDRDKASALGLSYREILETFGAAYVSGKISSIYTQSSQYDVIAEIEQKYFDDPDALSKLFIKSPQGQLVPLSTMATVKKTIAPVSVKHLGQMPSATILFNLLPGTAIGDVMPKIKKLAAETLPKEINIASQGATKAMESSLYNMIILLSVSIFVIYVVLGILYESFFHPITILSALPLAGFGAVGALYIFNKELDVYSFVGIIMLIGLVKKNGIMMVDFAVDVESKEKLDAVEAIYKACLIRFRPIMMTTMAALFGTLPIAIGYGAGAESRQPLGIAVVGGLFFSQFFTMYVTPVFYIYIDGFQRWMLREKTVEKKTQN